MRLSYHIGALTVALGLSAMACAQGTPAPATPPPAASTSNSADQPSWSYSLVTDGYIVPEGGSYVSPVFTANHDWLHLEARYNYESQRTGSLWLGYNYNVGKTVKFSATPMIGGVFGDVNGIAPGLELSLTWKKLSLSSSSEYVVDTDKTSESFFYSWPEITYNLLSWLNVGVVAQRTKAYRTPLDTQRGFLVGVTYKKWEFTTYVFNPDISQPTTVLELGVNF
jgi:hypothetical protein